MTPRCGNRGQSTIVCERTPPPAEVPHDQQSFELRREQVYFTLRRMDKQQYRDFVSRARLASSSWWSDVSLQQLLQRTPDQALRPA